MTKIVGIDKVFCNKTRVYFFVGDMAILHECYNLQIFVPIKFLPVFLSVIIRRNFGRVSVGNLNIKIAHLQV